MHKFTPKSSNLHSMLGIMPYPGRPGQGNFVVGEGLCATLVVVTGVFMRNICPRSAGDFGKGKSNLVHGRHQFGTVLSCFYIFFATYQNKRIVSCILINRRAPTFHCVLTNFSFSMFVKAKIRQKLNNVPKTKGH